MLEYKLPRYLPSAEELPDSDETPVDNELQELLPGLLKAKSADALVRADGLVFRH